MKLIIPNPRKAIHVHVHKPFYSGPKKAEHRDLIYNEVAKIILIAPELYVIVNRCQLIWVDQKPCNWEQGKPCLKILLEKARTDGIHGVRHLPSEENVCSCRIKNFSVIKNFFFPRDPSKQQNFWFHFTEVGVADYFKSLPSILTDEEKHEKNKHVARMWLKGASADRFLVNIYEFQNRKERLEEREHNQRVTGHPTVCDPNNRYVKSKNSPSFKTGYVPRNKKTRNTPVGNKKRGKNLTIAEQHYLDLGHSLIGQNRAMSRDIFQFIDHQFSEQKIDEKVDENTLNNDLLSIFAYVKKSMKDHFKEWNLNTRFSSSLQPLAWIKLLSGFVNIFEQKNVYECHVAMLGFREFAYHCEKSKDLLKGILFLGEEERIKKGKG